MVGNISSGRIYFPESLIRRDPFGLFVMRHSGYFSPMREPRITAATRHDADCKWILAALGPSPGPPEAVWRSLEATFGPIDYKGGFFAFDYTDYYRDEFGEGLLRGFVSFRGLGCPDRLPDLKHAAARLEETWAKDGKRLFNLDIGYMDPDKVVLASFKRAPSKLYLRDGVYGDLLLKYGKGRFDPLPWAFYDFQDGRYGKSLLVIREKLKSEMRRRPAGPMEKP